MGLRGSKCAAYCDNPQGTWVRKSNPSDHNKRGGGGFPGQAHGVRKDQSKVERLAGSAAFLTCFKCK